MLEALQDLIHRMKAQLADSETHLLHLHWSDVELLRRIAQEMAEDDRRIERLKQGLSQSVDEIMRDNKVLQARADRLLARLDRRGECQANRPNPAPFCGRCGRKIGEGCGESGPYAQDDPAEGG